jgi:hypothetical protein
MKQSIALLLVGITILGFALGRPWQVLAQTPVFQVEEIATIRWDGRENTHVIRPNGKVEFLGTLLAGASRPKGAEDRAFYLNVAMNALAKEGYQFAGRTDDEVVMKRSIPK